MLSKALNSFRPNASMGTLRVEGIMATVFRLALLRNDSTGEFLVEESTSVLTREAIILKSLEIENLLALVGE